MMPFLTDLSHVTKQKGCAVEGRRTLLNKAELCCITTLKVSFVFSNQFFVSNSTSVWSSRPQRNLREMRISASILVVAEGIPLSCHSADSALRVNLLKLDILEHTDFLPGILVFGKSGNFWPLLAEVKVE